MTIKIDWYKYKEVQRYLLENLSILSFRFVDNGKFCVIYFQFEDDAIIFKLSYGL